MRCQSLSKVRGHLYRRVGPCRVSGPEWDEEVIQTAKFQSRESEKEQSEKCVPEEEQPGVRH